MFQFKLSANIYLLLNTCTVKNCAREMKILNRKKNKKINKAKKEIYLCMYVYTYIRRECVCISERRE